jgi:hypothetical protein
MKQLLFLFALISAAPAWADNAASAPAAAKPAAAKPAAKASSAAASGVQPAQPLTCGTGCSQQFCSGTYICSKNKPSPACTPC